MNGLFEKLFAFLVELKFVKYCMQCHSLPQFGRKENYFIIFVYTLYIIQL